MPVSVKVTPGGKDAPRSEIDGVGNPVAVIAKLLNWPTVNVVLAALITAGG